jgi:hypothetical protein|tara:strand:- start:384 stop:638 length:255 start_codon:yes stop_codon:yes gene_type:complete
MRKVIQMIKKMMKKSPVRTQELTYKREYDGEVKNYFVNIFEDWDSHYIGYTYDTHGVNCGVKRFNKDSIQKMKAAKRNFALVNV